MKKGLFCLVLCLVLNVSTSVSYAHCHNHAYLVHKDFYQEEQTFHNCNRHYVVKETTVYYYSNGTRRSYTYSTIFNEDGTVVASNCRDVKHLIYNKKHYFTFYRNKRYNIMNEEGVIVSTKQYKEMQELAPNKLLVKLDKKFGIIDLNENKVVPIKYKKFEKIGEDLFLTKLNGYWGMINSSNKTIVKNEYEKISPIYDCYLLKKYGKYGLTDNKGNIIVEANCDKIKKLGEYIITKNNCKYGVYDSAGHIIADNIYKDVRLERNTLEGKLAKKWVSVVEY